MVVAFTWFEESDSGLLNLDDVPSVIRALGYNPTEVRDVRVCVRACVCACVCVCMCVCVCVCN